MFDSGFSELLLIMVVALVVVGPERLPGLARKVGYWVGRFRRYATTVRAEIEREINAEELRSMLSRQEGEIQELRDMLRDTRDQIRGEADEIADSLHSSGDSPDHQEGKGVDSPQEPKDGDGPSNVLRAKEDSEGQANEEEKSPPSPAIDDHLAKDSTKKQSVDKTKHGRKPE